MVSDFDFTIHGPKSYRENVKCSRTMQDLYAQVETKRRLALSFKEYNYFLNEATLHVGLMIS
uniref:Uncharacterized protein n=1 Tax=Anguilla anguilla TaxID=7936 RepID=A0A0E9PXH8_ANGAN